MGSIISSIFGGSSPKVQTVASEKPVVEDARKAKKARSALLETAGGVMGQEVQAGQTSTRQTLFGN